MTPFRRLGRLVPRTATESSAFQARFVAASGELIGTFLFLFTAYLGHAMSVRSAPSSATGGGNSNQTVIFIAISYGFSLLEANKPTKFLTSHLIFTILMLAAEKSRDTFIAPIGIDLSLFIIEVAGVNFSGASVDPARSFGPCVVSASFPGYHWIYWLGPVLGALVAAGLYDFVKFFDDEEANPGQDSAGDDEIDNEHTDREDVYRGFELS